MASTSRTAALSRYLAAVEREAEAERVQDELDFSGGAVTTMKQLLNSSADEDPDDAYEDVDVDDDAGDDADDDDLDIDDIEQVASDGLLDRNNHIRLLEEQQLAGGASNHSYSRSHSHSGEEEHQPHVPVKQ